MEIWRLIRVVLYPFASDRASTRATDFPKNSVPLVPFIAEEKYSNPSEINAGFNRGKGVS